MNNRALIPWLFQPITAHWRGQYALLPTILVTVLGLRIIAGSIPVQANFLAAALVALLSCALLAWQTVGTWRSANADLHSFGSPFTVWLSYAAIAVACVLTGLQIVDQLSGKPSLETMLAGYSKTQTLPVHPDGTTIIIAGNIDYDTRDALVNTLAQYPQANSLNFDSDGGLIYAARIMAKIILDRKLDTHVQGRCFSACTLIFMAGENRSTGEHAKLGFHQYEFIKVHPLREMSALDEQNVDLAYFKGRGISENFLKQIYETPHDEVWRPDRRTLLAAGVITK